MGGTFIKRTLLAVAVLAIAAWSITSFLKGDPHAGAAMPAGMMGGEMPPVPVTVAIAEKKPVHIWNSYSGRLRAVDYVELRPQVDGRIEEIKFQDGQIVNKGDVLFVIEPAPYEAAVAEAQAAVSGAKSQSELAARELKRAEDLIKNEAISEKTLDERRNAARLAKNMLDGANALLVQAKVNLDRAYLKAPISGRISRAEITVGNVVQAGPNAPVLSSIVSDEGIYADFEIDEQTYLKSLRKTAENTNGPTQPTPVQIVLGDGSFYTGYIRSFDNRIDTSSGTIRARAYFDNPGGTLLPGMYVTVRMGSTPGDEAIVITERAIGTDQDRKFVYVIDENGKAAYRPVTLGPSAEGGRVILDGLQPGEQVIAEGIVKIRPGMAVVPHDPNAQAGAEGQAPQQLLPDGAG